LALAGFTPFLRPLRIFERVDCFFSVQVTQFFCQSQKVRNETSCQGKMRGRRVMIMHFGRVQSTTQEGSFRLQLPQPLFPKRLTGCFSPPPPTPTPYFPSFPEECFDRKHNETQMPLSLGMTRFFPTPSFFLFDRGSLYFSSGFLLFGSR